MVSPTLLRLGLVVLKFQKMQASQGKITDSRYLRSRYLTVLMSDLARYLLLCNPASIQHLPRYRSV